MATVIAWKYDTAKRSFVFKMSDHRQKVISGVKGVIKYLDEALLRRVLSMGVPLTNYCAESVRLISELQKRFEVDEEVEEEKKVTEWTFSEITERVEVVWNDGYSRYYSVYDLLESEDLPWVEEILKVMPANRTPSAALATFQYRMWHRLDELRRKAEEDLFFADSSDGEDEVEDDDDENYYSEECPEDY